MPESPIETFTRQLGFRPGLACDRCPNLGKKTDITVFEAADSFKEFGFALCQSCSEAGRKAGKSHIEQKLTDPRKIVLNSYRKSFDQSKTKEEVARMLESACIDPDIDDIKKKLITLQAAVRTAELEEGVV